MLLMKKEPRKVKIREKKGLFGPVKEWEAEYVVVRDPEREYERMTDRIAAAVVRGLDIPNDAITAITHTGGNTQ
ncbi:hypothetical protein [Thermococcus thioreducens]|uniref:Uncharacterized protein n=1 Tax=Thermococcus thioreducens TaxID=277988 RepID=A0A1I0N2C1_9EURY|nr:hypothetical protein [Thermococcus thioreducens]ASJ12189.1 hypothetical protein A3L14_04500 [Thermococcus thioreducens]SEV95204.1 hypothetical protein SAMN05216170_1067 [Thermococcus thioreducens]